MNQETFNPACSIRLLLPRETFSINKLQLDEIEKSMNTLVNNFIQELNKSANMEIKASVDYIYDAITASEMSDPSRNYLITYNADNNYFDNCFSIFIPSQDFDNLLNLIHIPDENNEKSHIAENYLFNPIAKQFSAHFKKNFEKKRVYFDDDHNLIFIVTLNNGTVNSQIVIWAQNKFWLDFINADYTAKNITLPDFTTKNAYSVLGEIDYPEEEIKNMKTGDIIRLDNSYDRLAPYIVNNHLVAQGEPVIINEKTLGLRITYLIPPTNDFSTNDSPTKDFLTTNGHYIEDNPYNLLVILDTNNETPETIKKLYEGRILESGTDYIEDNFPVVYKNNVIALCRYKKLQIIGGTYRNWEDYIQITKVLGKTVPFIGTGK